MHERCILDPNLTYNSMCLYTYIHLTGPRLFSKGVTRIAGHGLVPVASYSAWAIILNVSRTGIRYITRRAIGKKAWSYPLCEG